MTTNKPEVVAYRHVNKEHPTLRGVSLLQDPSCYNELVKVEPLIRLSDYEALQAECEKLRKDAELWETIHDEIHRRAYKEHVLADRCDFTVDVFYEDYAAIDAAMEVSYG